MDALRVAGFLVVRVGKRAGRTRASTKSSEWIDGPVIKYSFSWEINRCRRRF